MSEEGRSIVRTADCMTTPRPPTTRESNRRQAWGDETVNTPSKCVAASIFLVASVAYVTLRSYNFLAVDGALRALTVFQHQGPRLSSNEHMLFPIDILFWTRFLSFVGVSASNPVEFIRLAETMNALAAAACLSILYIFCEAVSQSRSLSILIVSCYGLSRAFLAHATNSAEPMLGLFWSLAATLLVVISLSRGRSWLAFVGGFLLLAAMATYQSMVLIGPALLILIWYWPRRHTERDRLAGGSVASILFLMGCVAGLSIYGAAYYLSGTRTLDQMGRRFIHVAGAQTYAAFSPLKIAALPLGLTYALLPCLPIGGHGFRCLSQPMYRSWIPVALLCLITVSGAAILTAVLLWKSRSVLSQMECLTAICCLAAAGLDLAALACWLPTYDKLWLQPLACLALISAIVARHLRGAAPVSATAKNAFSTFGMLFLCSLAASNYLRAVDQSVPPVPYLQQAESVARIVKRRDLLVIDWNSVGILYQYVWEARQNTFNVPTDATLYGTLVASRLAAEIAQTRRSGSRVYFLGVLDESWEEWLADNGPMRAMPYDVLVHYRERSKTVASFRSDRGAITLRLLRDDTVSDSADERNRGASAVSPVTNPRGSGPRGLLDALSLYGPGDWGPECISTRAFRSMRRNKRPVSQ